MENKIKLLLVEDDSMLTYVVKSSLEGLIGGYEVITAVNGQEGLKAYQEYHPGCGYAGDEWSSDGGAHP